MTEPADPTATRDRRRHIARLVGFAALLGVLFYLTAVQRVIDVEYVRGVVESTGPLAPLAYVAVSSVLGALLVPGPLLAGGSGFLFGPVLGTFVTLGATVGLGGAHQPSRAGARAATAPVRCWGRSAPPGSTG